MSTVPLESKTHELYTEGDTTEARREALQSLVPSSVFSALMDHFCRKKTLKLLGLPMMNNEFEAYGDVLRAYEAGPEESAEMLQKLKDELKVSE